MVVAVAVAVAVLCNLCKDLNDVHQIHGKT